MSPVRTNSICKRARTRARKTQISVPVPKGYAKVLESLDRPLADRLARLASKLLILTSMTKERRGRKRHNIPFGRDSWVGMFGSDYAYEVARAAEETGLISRNHKYAAFGDKMFPKSVRLTRVYHRRSRLIGGVDEWTLERKPREKRKSKKSQPKDDVIAWLTSKLVLFGVGEVGTFRPKNGWDALTVDAIRRQDIYSTECDFGRFHTPFTAISRSSRETLFLREALQRLVTIDIKNSQPLILGVVQQQAQPDPELNAGAGVPNPIPICVPLFARADSLNWTELCEKGVVYETLLELLLAMKLKPYWQTIGRVTVEVDPSKWDRSNIKKAFLMVLFARWDDTLANPLYRVLELHFPQLAAFIRSVKEGGSYQKLAQFCQRTESNLMIQGVCGRLMRDYPDLPVLTIHDALIVPESHQEAVVACIRAVYAKVGLSPSMEVKRIGG